MWQFVLYLGKRNPKYLMKYHRYTVIDASTGTERITEIMPYTVIHLKGIEYETFLNSDKWQMVVLSVLCNFGKKSAEVVSKEIVQRLMNLSKNEEELDNSLLNLRILSQAHNLQALIIKTINKMKSAKIFDIRRDPLFNEGHEIGVSEGIEKGIEKNKFDVALNMVYKSYSDEQIVDILNLDLNLVKVIRQKYNELGLNASQWIDEQFLK